MKVGARLGVLVGFFAALLLLGAAIGLNGIARENAALDQVYQRQMKPMLALNAMMTLMAESRSELFLSLQHEPSAPFARAHDHPLSAHTDAIEGNRKRIDALWQEYLEQSGFARDDAAMAFAAGRARYLDEGLLPARAALLAGRFREANALLLERVNPLHAAQVRLGEALGEYELAQARAAHEAAQTRFNTVVTLVLGGLLLAALAGWQLSALIVRSVTHPLAQARQVFQRIAEGRYDTPVDIRGTDELADLLHQLRAMQNRLAADVSAVRRLADENGRIRSALDKASTNVMIADNDGNLIYLNESVRAMFGAAEADIRRELPNFSAAALRGGNFDAFHKDPGRIRDLIAGLRGEHRAEIRLGGRVFGQVTNPVFDTDGARLGTVVEWSDRTQQVQVEQDLATILEAASQGDFSRRTALEGKQGFSRDAAEHINTLMEIVSRGLEETARVLGSLSRGDLTAKVGGEPRGMFAQLKDDTNTCVDTLREMAVRIKESAGVLSAAAGEIAVGNADLSARTERQASNLQETAASMEEISGSVRQNADSARAANELARDADQVALRGAEVVNRVVVTMHDIQAGSRKIAEITGLIDGIAFQTNILALNAAVEAARAGEQGRGFAVVAAEVRSLAQRAALAAKEIKVLVDDAQQAVGAGAAQAHEAGETLGDLLTAFRRLGGIVADMSSATREQSNSVMQVTEAMAQLDEGTQQNAALVEQAAANAESLREQAVLLAEQVAAFRVGETPAAVVPAARPAAAAVASLSAARRARPAPLPKVRKASGGDDDEWVEF